MGFRWPWGQKRVKAAPEEESFDVAIQTVDRRIVAFDWTDKHMREARNAIAAQAALHLVSPESGKNLVINANQVISVSKIISEVRNICPMCASSVLWVHTSKNNPYAVEIEPDPDGYVYIEEGFAHFFDDYDHAMRQHPTYGPDSGLSQEVIDHFEGKPPLHVPHRCE